MVKSEVSAQIFERRFLVVWKLIWIEDNGTVTPYLPLSDSFAAGIVGDKLVTSGTCSEAITHKVLAWDVVGVNFRSSCRIDVRIRILWVIMR